MENTNTGKIELVKTSISRPVHLRILRMCELRKRQLGRRVTISEILEEAITELEKRYEQ
jgi:hypothetical protein